MKGSGGMSDDRLYHFNSARGQEWAAQNHPAFVKSVREQLTSFWQHRAMQLLDLEHIEYLEEQYTISEGYVILYQVIKEYELSNYFMQHIDQKLPSARRVRYWADGWPNPKWVWVAEEEEARSYFGLIKADRDRALSNIGYSSTSEVPEGAMPVSDIAKAIKMRHETLGRWVREEAVPCAGRFRTKRERTNFIEVYTWPGPVIAEIVRRNAIHDRRRPIKWCGLEELKRQGHGDWITAAWEYEKDRDG